MKTRPNDDDGGTSRKRGLFELVGGWTIKEMPRPLLDKGADRQWVIGNQQAIAYYDAKAKADFAKTHPKKSQYKMVGMAMSGYELFDMVGGVKASVVTLKGKNLSCTCGQFADGRGECRHMALVREKGL